MASIDTFPKPIMLKITPEKEEDLRRDSSSHVKT
jgi:hypothetical protein